MKNKKNVCNDATFITDERPYLNDETFASKVMIHAAKCCKIIVKSKGYRLSDEDFEDVVSNTCMKAYNYRNSYDSEKSKLGTWMNRIAYNCIMDALKKKQAEPESVCLDACRHDDDERFESRFEIPGYGYEADRDTESEEECNRIYDAIDSLPEELRLVMILHVEEGLQPRQIAKRLGCTDSVASTRLFRARRMIKAMLERSEF